MPLLRALLKDPAVAVTRGTTYQNRANLAPEFLDQIVRKYEGTRLGRQEIEAEILDDLPGGLWSRGLLEAARVRSAPPMARIVVAIDPAVSSGEMADETGIVVAGRDTVGRGWVLADLSGRYRPIEWAKTAIAAYHAHGADRIVAEINNGGEMVETTVRITDPNVPFTSVRASRGKITRAEPVAALYEQGKVYHLGAFPQLEDQMCTLTRGDEGNGARFSPDRVDALVWALTALLVTPMSGQGIYEAYQQLSDQWSESNRSKLCS
jgi:phage terminase large subunit-like protein